MRTEFLTIIVSLLCLGLSANGAAISELLLYPSADTSLMENYPSNNFGGGTYFNSGSIQNTAPGQPYPYLYPRNRGLIKFDLAGQIPLGSKIISVSLGLEVTRISNDNPSSFSRYDLHRVLRPWGEGSKVTYIDPPRFSTNGIGAPATFGEANWLYRSAMTTNTWAIPGGAPGIDYAVDPTAFQNIFGPVSSPYYFLSELSSNLITEIQYWIDHPENNFGWMILAHSEEEAWTARRFASRESGIPPKLVLQFIAPPVFDNVEISGHQISFTFTASAGATYGLEYRDSLTSGSWQTLTTLMLPNDTTQVVLTDSINSLGSRFYRLSVQ